VCGAIRRKCAVDPTMSVKFFGEKCPINKQTFIPPINPFRLKGFPQTIYRILIERSSKSSVGPDHSGLVVNPCQSCISRLHDETLLPWTISSSCSYLDSKGLTTHTPDTLLLSKKVQVLLAGRMSFETNRFFVKL
jgi:hypothetical protein